MRAALLGLLGVTLFVSAGHAQATSCSAEKNLLLTAQPDENPLPNTKVRRPDLVGKPFRIVSIRKRGHDYLAEVASGKEHFWVVNNVTPRTTPGSFFQSFEPGSKDVFPKTLLSRKLTKPSGDLPWDSSGYASNIHGGPLAGLELLVTGCRT